MWKEILLEVVVIAVGGFFGWIFGKKKAKAETVSIEIENVNKALSIFRKDIVEPLREELIRTRSELEEAREQIQLLTIDMKKLHQENEELRHEIQQK